MPMYFNLYTLARQEKRRAQQKKNRKHQLMFEIMRMRRADAQRLKDNERSMRPKREEKGAKTEWSDKVSKVRNRLTGKKRESKERWNRFAGTGDAGGRGL
jgi:hypothetical protein